MKRKKRVLVLEDEQFWVDDLTEALESGGFRVSAALNIEDAKKLIQQDFYHLLSLDLSMIHGGGTAKHGMEWLDELNGQKLNQSLTIIILSGVGDKSDMRTVFSRYHVADFLDKDDFSQTEFLNTVEQIFREHANINLELDIHWQGPKPEQVLANMELDGKRVRKDPELQQRLFAELDDLLCRLFHYAKSLIVTPLEAGHGKGAVLKIQLSLGDAGVPQPVIVKFGEAALIDREYRNFKEYVEGFIGGARSTNVKDLKRTQRLGGIVYSFLGATGGRFESFGEFYRRSDAAQIKSVIDHLFRETCAQWYSNPGTLHHHNLSEDYKQLFGLNFDKLEEHRENLKSVQGRDRLLFEDLTRDRRFTNPILAAREQDIVKPTYRVVTHGDFNENNILLDQSGTPWLIDFGSTGPGHILRDVAMLDSVVRFHLLAESQATLAERLVLEESLCELRHFNEVEQLQQRFSSSNPAITKAFEVSAHILTRVRTMIARNPTDDDISEYYAALLYNALNKLRFYSLPNLQRQHALLSASLLADRLGLRA